MGYVPVMPPGVRVRPVPPQNQRGNNVGASIPPLRPLYDDRGRCYGWWADKPRETRADELAPFWTPGTITAAILSLCLFSYGIGMWVGQMQGMRIAELQAEQEHGS